MRVFLNYGFQRTTMDDIARAAEISRPALYLVFRNKTDIYRALASDFLNATLANASSRLESEAPFVERLCASVDCTMGMMRQVEASPHGGEILDMRNSLAADIVAEGRARFKALVTGAMEQEMRQRGCDAATDRIAALSDMLLDALDGIKQRGAPPAELARLVPVYIDTIAEALAPGK